MKVSKAKLISFLRRDQLIPLLILGLLKEKPGSYGYELL
ncbi:PadR family transcriptional regulator, partial [Bacillus spizizenii]|nr:PadR family transcriptional regulator [Bacillus spizizenii]